MEIDDEADKFIIIDDTNDQIYFEWFDRCDAITFARTIHSPIVINLSSRITCHVEIVKTNAEYEGISLT